MYGRTKEQIKRDSVRQLAAQEAARKVREAEARAKPEVKQCPTQ
jgi:hypothetical protein